MKKISALIIAFMLLLGLSGCGGEKQEIEIIIPAGSMEAFVFSDEVFEATDDKIIVTAGAGFSDTSVTLKTEKVSEEIMYEPTYLTHGMPVEIETEKGGWFKIGVSVQNPSEHDIAVSIYVQNIEIKSE
ncbi:MAG: hypothetical protein IJ306_03680 [Oscillospiraceae bacterium]|nr:hypothetical protein [Oscillospiraceae bacterium]